MIQYQATLLDADYHQETTEPFRAKHLKPSRPPLNMPEVQGRRSVSRHSLWRTPLVRLVAGEGPPYKALVRDLSMKGMALVCSQRLEPGLAIAIHLQDRIVGDSWTVEAEVRHATLWKEGRWLLGCRFTGPIPGDRVASLVHDERRRSAKDKILAELLNCPWVITWN